MKKRNPKTAGFTLLELMIAVAIVALLAGIALPLYNDYIDTGQEGVLIKSISTINVFQEDFRLRNGNYVAGQYTNGVPDAALAVLGWDPNTDTIDFAVTVDGANYQVTATSDTGASLCRRFPAGVNCI